MDPFKRIEIGSTGLTVTRMGLGARGIVDPNVQVSDLQAATTVKTSLEMGINYIDTSPRYGLGKSEQFVGQVVSRKDRDSFVLSTKVGRLLDPGVKGGWTWDFSIDRRRGTCPTAVRSLAASTFSMLRDRPAL